MAGGGLTGAGEGEGEGRGEGEGGGEGDTGKGEGEGKTGVGRDGDGEGGGLLGSTGLGVTTMSGGGGDGSGEGLSWGAMAAGGGDGVGYTGEYVGSNTQPGSDIEPFAHWIVLAHGASEQYCSSASRRSGRKSHRRLAASAQFPSPARAMGWRREGLAPLSGRTLPREGASGAHPAKTHRDAFQLAGHGATQVGVGRDVEHLEVGEGSCCAPRHGDGACR